MLVLAGVGVPTGLLWWWLAPRADFRITETGPVVVGQPSEELLVAVDAVLALLLAGVGLLAGTAAWFLRRRRGVATVVALAMGTCLTAVVGWQLGELLGPGPTEVQLAEVGNRVTTGLSLASYPALALAPFAALLAYVVAALYARRDVLGRLEPGAQDPARTPVPDGGQGSPAGGHCSPDGGQEVPDERPLVDMPPPGRPSA